MIPAMIPCLPDIARKRIFDYVRGDSMILLKKLIIIIYHYMTDSILVPLFEESKNKQPGK